MVNERRLDRDRSSEEPVERFVREAARTARQEDLDAIRIAEGLGPDGAREFRDRSAEPDDDAGAQRLHRRAAEGRDRVLC